MAKGLSDEWFATQFMDIKQCLGEIKETIEDLREGQDECTRIAEEQEKRIEALEQNKTGPNIKTLATSGGIGGIGAVLISLFIALCKYMGWV